LCNECADYELLFENSVRDSKLQGGFNTLRSHVWARTIQSKISRAHATLFAITYEMYGEFHQSRRPLLESMERGDIHYGGLYLHSIADFDAWYKGPQELWDLVHAEPTNPHLESIYECAMRTVVTLVLPQSEPEAQSEKRQRDEPEVAVIREEKRARSPDYPADDLAALEDDFASKASDEVQRRALSPLSAKKAGKKQKKHEKLVKLITRVVVDVLDKREKK
jgi:hypothetical protein